MINYIYPNKPIAPDIEQLHVDVANSAMTNKQIIGATWKEDFAELVVHWTVDISQADKTILDALVAALPSGE